DGQIEHELLPVAVFVDFLLLDAHRRLRGLDAARWLLYPLAYFAFTTIRGFVSPGSAYPYGFVDLDALGWTGLLVNVVLYGAGFFVLGLLIVGIDRLLPTGPLIGRYPERSPAARSETPEAAGAGGADASRQVGRRALPGRRSAARRPRLASGHPSPRAERARATRRWRS